MKKLLVPLALLGSLHTAWAQTAPVTAEAAWARATVRGQQGTGAFMQLTAREPLTLVGASTPVAGVAELHEMKMEGDVMKMRAIPALALPAGKPVQLKPGGHHLMLMDLKAPLKPDTRVPITLNFRNAKGEASSLLLSVAVTVQPPAGAAPAHKH